MMMTVDTLTKSLTFRQRTWIAFRRNKPAFCSAVFLAILFVSAILIPFLTPYTYFDIDLGSKNSAPSFKHWFGTDDLGRDVFTRIWYGARISLFIGITAALIDLVIGILWGGIAALSGGKIGGTMMRLTDVMSSIPSLLIIICIMMVAGPGLHTIIIALSIFGWITMARIVRGQFLQLKEQGYVLAARSLGASYWRILFYHLLPNASGPIIVTLTLTVPSAIFAEAFLSYLGLGVQAPIASWGVMANEGLPALEYYPWRLFFPTSFISATMLAFNILGDGLSDAFSTASKNLH